MQAPSAIKSLKLSSLPIICIILSGCASMFGDNTRQISVNSEPVGADVYYQNQLIGQTPTTVKLKNVSSPAVIRLEKNGYMSQFATVNMEYQTIGMLNIFFPPGFLIDAMTGNSMRISKDSQNLTVILQKED